MKQLNVVFIGLLALFCAGCAPIKHKGYGATSGAVYSQPAYMPQCNNETTIAIYDEQGTYTVPGCVDYTMPSDWTEVTYDMPYGYEEPENEAEGDFPEVENNKYPQNQVILQNLNTRVLAYCRGNEEQIAYCISRLEGSCYVRLSEIPKVTAKSDTLRRGSYPSRRWREGDVVPRW